MTIDLEALRRDVIYDNGALYWASDPEIVKSWPGSRKRYAGCRAFKKMVRDYMAGRFGGRRYYAHQIVWLLFNDELPKSIDHINGDKCDNRVENLRAATQQEQSRNLPLRRDNKTGFVGVRFRADLGNKWIAEIHLDGKQKYLGCFSDKMSAVAARAEAARAAGFSPIHGRIAKVFERTRKAKA